MTNIQETLAERGSRYGEFDEHARITQNLKRAMADSPNWSVLSDDMKEALEMVAHKMGRILNGDPDYDDSWRDIIGYTQLVLNRLEPPTSCVAQPAFKFMVDAEGRN
jgi:hypothetical protein